MTFEFTHDGKIIEIDAIDLEDAVTRSVELERLQEIKAQIEVLEQKKANNLNLAHRSELRRAINNKKGQLMDILYK